MARIPTYTAEGGIPAGGTGPQASTAAFAAPARALGGLGETIAQTGEQVSRGMFKLAEIKQQRQEQDDAFWAAKTATDLNRDLMKAYEDGKGKEDQAEAFLQNAESRLTELESTAPNPNAAKKLRLAIDDNISTIYGRALNLSSQVREQNRISEFQVNAQNIGQPINSSDELTKPLALMTAQSMIGQQLQLINSLPYSEASKRKIRGAFIEELALNVSTNAPEFALNLINTTDLDEAKKNTLRSQIGAYSESRNKIAEITFAERTRKSLDDGLRGNVQIKMPPDQEYKVTFGKNWEVQKEKDRLEYDKVNSVIGFSNENGEFSYQYQRNSYVQNYQKYSPEARALIEQKLEFARKAQSSENVADWMRQSNKQVQRAFDIASNAHPEKRAELLTAANAILIQYQGTPPDVITDPKERAKYLGRIPGQFRLLSKQQAEIESSDISAMSGPRLAKYMQELAIRYPDDKQRAIVWNDIVTLSQNGVRAEIQFAQMMPDPKTREKYLSVVQELREKPRLSEDKRTQFTDKLEATDEWKNFSKALSPGTEAQRKGEATMFADAIVAYAQNLSSEFGTGAAIEKSIEELITKSWGVVNVNGQWLVIQRRRSDFDDKPARTDAEIDDIAEKLRLAISMVPMDQVSLVNPSGMPMFPNLELILNETEKLNEIQTAIRSSGFWYMNEDGQGASLYLMDAESRNAMPLLDKKGKPFSVDFDTINQTPLGEFGIVSKVAIPGLYPSITGMTVSKVSEVERVSEFPRLMQPPGFVESSASVQAVGRPAMVPSMTGMTLVTQPMEKQISEPKTKINMPPAKAFWQNLSK